MNQTLTLQFDGGSRGNPGPAGIGIVLRAEDHTPIFTLGRFIGKATNNVAEYRALITGLAEALKLGAKRIYVLGDSELIIKQMKGQYRVKSPDLQPLFEEAQQLIQQFEQAKLDHNLREKNKLADKLANLAMDRRADVTDADDPPIETPSAPEAKSGDRWNCARCGCQIEVRVSTRLRPHQLRDFICQCGQRMHLA